MTGWGSTLEELAAIAERGLTLARLFNLREGFSAADDHLPQKVTRPHVSGPLSKAGLDVDALAAQVKAYYLARGWSDTGVPLDQTLERLGINELVGSASAARP